MREIDGMRHYTFAEACEKIGRGKLTIRGWYAWAEESGHLDKLPAILWSSDPRPVRLFSEKDIADLIQFRDGVKYGSMSEFNEKRWGNRGIQKKRSIIS